MIQIGNFRVHLLSDGITLADPGGPFGLVPRVLWQRYLQPDAEGMVPMGLHTLLIQTEDQNVLVDTGLGTKMTAKQVANWHLKRPTGDLVAAIGRLGLTPDDITLVIDTHLHADHCSGNTRLDESGVVVPAYPRARYVVQRREYEDAIRPNERTAATYLAENWQCLIENGQMQLLDGDTEILPGLWGIMTPGHTPGHMTVRLESQGQHLAFVCDMASFAVHFERLAWMTAYDVEPLITLETKRQWQKWALETNALLIFPHDTLRPVGRLTLDDKGKPSVVPVEEPFA